MELAGGRALLGSVRLAVDHQPARAADAFTAVAVEGDGLVALVDESLVEHVEHLEERHVLVDLGDRVDLEPAAGAGTVLTPHLEGEVHL